MPRKSAAKTKNKSAKNMSAPAVPEKKHGNKPFIIAIITVVAVIALVLLLLNADRLVGKGYYAIQQEPQQIQVVDSSSRQIITEAVCGNGVVEGNEECDDGGVCEFKQSSTCIVGSQSPCEFGACITVSNDGCSSTCQLETVEITQIDVSSIDQNQLQVVVPGTVKLSVRTFDLQGEPKDSFLIGDEIEVRVYLEDSVDFYDVDLALDIDNPSLALFTQYALNGEVMSAPVTMFNHASNARFFFKKLGTFISGNTGDGLLLFTVRVDALKPGDVNFPFAYANFKVTSQGSTLHNTDLIKGEVKIIDFIDLDGDGVNDADEHPACPNVGNSNTVNMAGPFAGCLYGDVGTPDGCVNLADIAVIAANVDLSCVPQGPHDSEDGDVNGDGCVNLADIALIATNVDLQCGGQ